MIFLILPTVVLTLTSLVILGFTVFFTSPRDLNDSLILINLVYFFSAAFVSLAGSLTLVLYWVGNLRLKKTRVSQVESIHKPRIVYFRSLRHGTLIAIALVGIGLLKTFNFANLVNIILLISALTLVEIYFFGH